MKLRNAANALANDPMFADLQPPHLQRADARLADAVSALEGADVNAAVAAEEKALGRSARNSIGWMSRWPRRRETIAESEFRRRAGDQAKNRGTAENLEATSARLGDVGVGLRKDLIRAGASMQSAEQGLGKTAAGPAADDQSAALDVLAKSREDFARSIEKLLVVLRVELQARLVAALTEMHVEQTSIRETTQAQAPRVLQKSRTALIAVAGLSKNEADIAEHTETLLALVEETEFGIALPTTLRIFSREMHSIEAWLKAGDVAARTVALETRLEEDLLGLAEAVRRLSPSDPSAAGRAPLRRREGTRARAEPHDRRAQDGPDARVPARRRYGCRQQDPQRRITRRPPSGARSRRWRPRKTRSATRSRRSPSVCRSPVLTPSEGRPHGR